MCTSNRDDRELVKTVKQSRFKQSLEEESQSLEEEWRGTESMYLKSSVKFPQSVMIWAAMSSAGVGPLSFLKSTGNAAIYQEI